MLALIYPFIERSQLLFLSARIKQKLYSFREESTMEDGLCLTQHTGELYIFDDINSIKYIHFDFLLRPGKEKAFMLT